MEHTQLPMQKQNSHQKYKQDKNLDYVKKKMKNL